MNAGCRRGSALVITLLILVILTAAGLYAVGLSTSGIESVSSAEQEQSAIDAAEAGLYYGIDRFPDPIAERELRLPNGSRYEVTVSHTGTIPLPGYDMGWAQVRFVVRAVGHPPREVGRTQVAEAEGAFGPVESGTEPHGGKTEPDGGMLIPLISPSPFFHDSRDPHARSVFVQRHERRNRILLAAIGGEGLQVVDGGSTGALHPIPGTEAPVDPQQAVWTVADIRPESRFLDREDLSDTGWRTIVVAGVGGERGGLFVFDVTDPRPGGSSRMLWKIPHGALPMLGSARSRPAVGKIRVPSGRLDAPGATVDRWVVLVGAEKGILVLDASTGRILQLLSHPLMGEVAASPSIAYDGQGYIGRAYMGDLSGNLWRAVVNDAGGFDLGSGPFFRVANGRISRKIHGSCAVVSADGANQRFWIYFGTGDPDIRVDGDTGGFFAVVDDPHVGRQIAGKISAITEADLTDASPFFRKLHDPKARFPSLEGDRMRGWYAMLPAAGERLRFSPRVFFSNLFLPTSIPSPEGSGRSESGKIYGFGILPGNNPGVPALYDRTGSGSDPDDPGAAARVRTVEGGWISSSPQLTVGARGVGHLSFRTADGWETQYGIPAPRRTKSVRYWRNFPSGSGEGD